MRLPLYQVSAALLFSSASLISSFTPAIAANQAPAASAAQIKVGAFFADPRYASVQLSPDGKFLSALAPDAEGRHMLVTIDLSTMAPTVVAHYNDANVRNPQWVNSQRLVFSLEEKKDKPDDARYAPGLFAVDRDGKDPRQLVSRDYISNAGSAVQRRLLPPNTQFHSVIANAQSDDIFVMQAEGASSIKRSIFNLLRLNTRTGQTSVMQRPGLTMEWEIDHNGEPRIAVTTEETSSTVHYKAPGSNEWSKLYSYDHWNSHHQVVGLSDTALYVRDDQGKNHLSLYRYDLQKRQLDPTPLLTLDGFDFSGNLVQNKQGKLLGIHYESDAAGTVWLDKAAQELQKKIDKLLPATINRINLREGAKHVLVRAYSDVNPGMFYLYQPENDKLVLLGRVKPDIDPALMSNKDFIKYPARDGLEIPAWLTLPRGKEAKNLPLVLMVHGGPNVRGGGWFWRPEVQFLASRGYAVLEPEFRGSTGYGKKLERAGWKQWDLSMQDDLVDGVKWAVAKGYVDPKRECVAGASHGGYAALWGLIRDADLYKCGISWVGVSDLDLLFSVSWSDSMEETEKHWMPLRIGDPKKDAEQFKATSPLAHAHKLKLPLILAYGAQDVRVPIVHGTRFYNALKDHNPNVEWIVYKNEGHG
ncbi:prolyl oligopeptidase family serine peptidase [Massilia sp. W12]|uniref:S9 family peptidase n=1 Tax=Massilia sp. W12 TaxID=3126507 RepID=UPI0030D22FBF